MAEQPSTSNGNKTLISVTTLVNRIAALENRVKSLEEANRQQQVQIAQLSLNATQAAPPQQHIQLAQLAPSASPPLPQQDAPRLWGTASAPMTGIYPVMQASLGSNVIQNPTPITESERQLVQAIKEVQQQTRNDYPERSLVSQHMIYRGTQDKVYTFKAICKSAERKGLIEMQANPGGGPAWITLKRKT